MVVEDVSVCVILSVSVVSSVVFSVVLSVVLSVVAWVVTCVIVVGWVKVVGETVTETMVVGLV